MRACHQRGASGVGARRLPRRWRAWESTTGTTIIARAGKPSAGADRMQAAMRPAVVPLSAAAETATTIRAPVLARAMTGAATIGARAPTHLAAGGAHAPTGTTTAPCDATVAHPTDTAAATALGVAHGHSATTGRPQLAGVALHAAPRPPIPVDAIGDPAPRARQRAAVASGAISRSTGLERDAASIRVIRAPAVACRWRKTRKRQGPLHLARR